MCLQIVVPRHLLTKDLPIVVAKKFKSMKVPVVLHYFKQSFYSNLQKACIEALKKNRSNFL